MASSRAYLKLHWIVFLWGFTAVIGRLLQSDALITVFYRTLAAALLLLVYLRWIRPVALRTPARAAAALFANGALIGLHWVLFFASVQAANVSVCLVGMSTCTLWTALLDPLLARRPVRWFEIVLGLAVVAGIVLIFGSEFHYQTGLYLSLASAAVAALFGILNGLIVRGHDPRVATVIEMCGACVFCGLALAVHRTLSSHSAPASFWPPAADWPWLLVLAAVCTSYAYTVYIDLLKDLSVFAINLANNFEPLYGILLAALLFREHQDLGGMFYLGGAVILAAVLFHPVLDRRFALESG